jgi:hypothetical protein
VVARADVVVIDIKYNGGSGGKEAKVALSLLL